MATLAMVLSTPAMAGWTKTGDANTVFHGKGPAGFKIEGTTSALTLKDDGKTLTITVPLKDLDTGIALRNNHMREKYLEVATYPDAVLEVPMTAFKVPESGEASGDAKGKFSLHGKSKEVSFKYQVKCAAGTCSVEGSMDFNFEEFGVKVPTYLGITVKPDLNITTSFKAKKEG